MKKQSDASNRKSDGFTLIEVLIALGILTIALSALIKGLAENTRNAATLQDRMIAHWVAANAATEIQLRKNPVFQGSATMAGQEWYWTARIIAQTDDQLRHINVEVRNKNDTQ